MATHRRWIAALAGALLAGGAPAAAAQLLPLSVEARGGVAGPTGDLAQRFPSHPGAAFAVLVDLRVLPLLPVWLSAGYGEQRFRSRDAVDVDGDGQPDGRARFEVGGYSLGVRAALPSLAGLLPVVPWARAGLVQLRWTAEADDAFVDSEAGVGLEGGVGLELRLAPGLRLTPGVVARRATVDLRNSRRPKETLRTWAAEVGLRLAL